MYLYGKNASNTLDPSSGGIGIRLNAASPMLMFTIWNRNISPARPVMLYHLAPKNLKNNTVNTAVKIFPATPANDTITKSRLGCLKYLVFIGTGLAQPTPTNSNINVPTRSKCANGFSDSLPLISAVGSPTILAANP